MGLGGQYFALLRAGRWPGVLACAVVAATTLSGCGPGTGQPDAELPPLPRYWQGSVAGPKRDAWASADAFPTAAGEPWQHEPWQQVDSGARPAASPYDAAVRDAAGAQPYTVTTLPASAVAGPADPPTSAGPAMEPPPGSETAVAAGAESQAPHKIADLAAPAAGLSAPEVMPPALPQPAPGDVLVVAALPALAAPTPEQLAAAEPALTFPAEPPISERDRPTPSQDTVNSRAAGSTAGDHPSRTPTSTPAAATAGGSAALAPAVRPPQPASAPTGAIVNQRATAVIRRGYELAERGAYYAARSEFISALRMIAEAKDQIHGAPRRTIALAQGLRAIDEAADFTPAGGRPGGELQMSVLVAAHRTPVAKTMPADALLPNQLADAYLQYAQEQLGAAVAGEPAGSMALHALGKLQSRLGRAEPETNPQADARAFALQQAALLARNDNHLAAHELGVLLAESGHYRESGALLQQVAQRSPHAVVYRNLARVERQMGRPDLATASERQAEYLASRGLGGPGSVQWVSTDALARTPDALAATGGAQMAAAPAAARPAANVPMTARGPAMMQR